MKLKNPIYLDYSSSTPVNPTVLEKLLPYMTEHFGNSLSPHQWGWAADHAVETARKQVAALLNCRPDEITFTSSCTESNNWALVKLSEELLKSGPLHLISTSIEHSSVAKVLTYLETLGVEVTRLTPNGEGIISLEDFKAAIKPYTRLASIIWVQNEIGSIQPIEEIAALCSERQIYFHCDGTQAVGKFAVDLQKLPIGLLSFSGHKLYAPKGVGVLFHRKSNPRIPLMPLLHGGGHEQGYRSSTLNTPAIVGLGVACELAKEKMQFEWERVLSLKKMAQEKLKALYPQVEFNGSPERSIPHILHFTLRGAPMEAMTPHLTQLGLSQGAACGSHQPNMSMVLKSLNKDFRYAQESFRMSFGQPTTDAQVIEAIEFLCFLANNK
ncbi:MAG: cysteine desulfurase family protein [Bdellovibrionia bacterium]